MVHKSTESCVCQYFFAGLALFLLIWRADANFDKAKKFVDGRILCLGLFLWVFPGNYYEPDVVFLGPETSSRLDFVCASGKSLKSLPLLQAEKNLPTSAGTR